MPGTALPCWALADPSRYYPQHALHEAYHTRHHPRRTNPATLLLALHLVPGLCRRIELTLDGVLSLDGCSEVIVPACHALQIGVLSYQGC